MQWLAQRGKFLATIGIFTLSFSLVVPDRAFAAGGADDTEGVSRPGIRVVLGLPGSGEERVATFVDTARQSPNLTIYFQDADADVVRRVRDAAEAAGLLGQRVFVGEGSLEEIQLADNIAGEVLVARARGVDPQEILRVLHPGGRATVGEKTIEKPRPAGVDSWSHPFHRPDNNPQSSDQLARAPYLTQFLAEPKFCPMPEISVAAAGRVYRAFGHIAHKANQNAMLNTLIGVNAYNGTILWKRKLREGFMIHRNTLVATEEGLYLGDQVSCKLLDGDTGEVIDRIVIEEGVADGPVWKWMGMEEDASHAPGGATGRVLHALVGAEEFKISTKPSNNPGMGHWPWGMWEGHDYSDPQKNFGFGRNFVAIDLGTKEILWNHREEEVVDARGVCMRNGRIYFYSPGKHLGCLDASTGELLWRNSDEDLLEAIGPNERAQHYVTGYATTTYVKCTDDEIYFAGPQRTRLVAASTTDGSLVWQRTGGNLQLVLRDDGIYAAGPGTSGVRLAYGSGVELGQLPTRRACTRATGSVDSVFYRTRGGTVRVDVEANRAHHIAPMRPPCQDGVIISDGHLYWGPWMCGCQLSLYGHIALGPSGDFDRDGPPPSQRRELFAKGGAATDADTRSQLNARDWPAYRRDAAQSAATPVKLPGAVSRKWRFRLPSSSRPTAPVAAGDAVYFGDDSGTVWCLDRRGETRWKARTGGAVYFPPALDGVRAHVGSADGHVHALDARSGDIIWRFRVAPSVRRIPVYGKLISTWPVAGGVVHHDGNVYAAAGIAHYDGTHVAALDGATGEVRWYNGDSGSISARGQSGISLQGSLFVAGDTLAFAGGGVYRLARFDLESGRCRNTPSEGVTSQFQTAFHPYYPEYAEFLSFRRDYADGRILVYEASYEGSRHSALALLERPDGDADRAPRDLRAERRRRRVVWQAPGERYNSIVATAQGVLASGRRGDRSFLAAIDLDTGKRHWDEDLTAPAVRGGTAVTRHGEIIASLQDGTVVCYGED